MSSTTPGPSADQVRVDRQIEYLIPFFLENRRERLAEGLALCDQGDLARLRRLGHDFKGTCGSYGFAYLSRLGGELEQAADLETACALVRRMGEHLGRVRVEYV